MPPANDTRRPQSDLHRRQLSRNHLSVDDPTASTPSTPPLPTIQSPRHRLAFENDTPDSDSGGDNNSIYPPSSNLTRRTSAEQPPNRSNTGGSSSLEITAEAYAQLIHNHATRNVANSIYPGQNYRDLATWLWYAENRIQVPPSQRSGFDDGHCLAVFVDLAVNKKRGGGEAEQEEDNRMRFLYAADNARESLASLPSQASEAGAGQLLLLRGCPSPEWLTGLGGKYRVDPEFFQRHLDFFVSETGRSAAGLPSLPSTTRNIVQLAVNTVLHSDRTTLPSLYKGGEIGAKRRRNLQAQRRADAEDLEVYRRKYQNTMQCGDSIVREFGTLDERIAIVEQRISFCVQKCGHGWMALVWIDAGRPLINTPTDSWFMEPRYREALPTVQHNPRMSTRQGTVESALLQSKPKKDAATSSTTSSKTEEEKEPEKHPLHNYAKTTRLQQSLHLLPFEINTFLDPQVVKTDAFYALHNLFQFAAFSSIQVLNTLDAQIRRELGVLTAEHKRSHILENLQFVSELLDRQVDSIKSTVHAIKTRKESGWPSKIDRTKRATAAAKRLETDFDYLLARALDLRRRCTEGMGVMMNRAVVAESRKGMEQQERVRRLTILATLFIPLSFVTSVFGMNFREFGTGRLSIWLFAAVCVPCLCAVYVAYVWEDRFAAGFQKGVVGPIKEGVGVLGKCLGASGTRSDQVV